MNQYHRFSRKAGRPSRLSKKKEQRKLASQRANATKARMRREGPEPDRPSESLGKTYQSEWIVTLTNRVDGESVTWIPSSLNDLKRRASVIFANYTPS